MRDSHLFPSPDPLEPHMLVENCAADLPTSACAGRFTCRTAAYDKMRKMTQSCPPLYQLPAVDPGCPETYDEQYRFCSLDDPADVNNDGSVNLFDIQPFVALLTP